MDQLTNIWNEVRDWPPDERRELATRLLHSLQTERNIGGARYEALRDLIGIWKTNAPPSDEQVRQLVEHERARKYG